MVERFGLDADSHVVEIASNDGYLLQYFKERGIPVLGIEPAANVAEVAVEKGLPTLVEFFGVETARSLAPDSSADLLIGNNVLAHVPDINDFVGGMKLLLKPGGVITMEFPHLMRLIDEKQWDTIYHEHFSYLSFTTARRVFAAHGLRLFDVEELPTHGGSLRIFGCHDDDADKPDTERARELLAREDARRLLERSRPTSTTASASREDKREILATLDRAQGRRASGSSATARRRRATRCSTTAASGATSSTTPSTSTRTSRATCCRVTHIRRGLPFTSAEHDPHLPALQFHRTARSFACSAWI